MALLLLFQPLCHLSLHHVPFPHIRRSPSPLLSALFTRTIGRLFFLTTSKLQRKGLISKPKSLRGVKIPAPLAFGERRLTVVHASADTGGKGVDGADNTPPGETEAVSVEKLPLESKEQLKLEQRLRMKLAKKIRLRRKRLVRKRQLRKKGRWPPSKMQKNKNV